MVVLLAIAILFLTAAISFRVTPSPVYPPFAMAGTWAVLLLFSVSQSFLFPIHDETVLFYVAGALAFCFGGFCAHFISREAHIDDYQDPVRVRRILDVLIIVLIIGLPFYLRFIAALLEDATSRHMWALLRESLIEEHADAVSTFSAMDNLVVLANCTVLLAWFHRKTERLRAWISFALFCIYNLLTAGRAGFVSVLLSLFAIEVLRARRVPWRSIAALGLVFVFSFFGLAILGEKAGSSSEESASDNWPLLVEGLQLYTIGPTVAFDGLYRHPNSIPPTQNIDRNFRIIAAKLGLHTEVPYLHADYSTVGPSGVNMNVYTIYFSYFPQLGTVGSVAIMFFLGIGLTLAYFRAVNGGPWAITMFGVLFYGIPLSGYSENYFMNLNFLGKMLLLTFLCYGYSSRRSKAQVAFAC